MRKSTGRAAEQIDVNSLLERVVRIVCASGAAESGVLITNDQTLVRSTADIEAIPDSPRSRAWLSSVARARHIVRIGPRSQPAGHEFPGTPPGSFLAVPSEDGSAVVYAAEKRGGFTRDDEDLLASLARLVATAAPAQEPVAPAELVSVISHELRNPLASIRGFSVLLRDREESLSEQERHEFVEAIVRQTDNLSKLIGDVLDVSQMVAGRFHYASTEYDLRALLAECVADAGAAYPSHHFRLGASDQTPIRGDRDRMKQALMNLLSNAARYSHAGSEVRVESRTGERVLFMVSDQGVGIEREDLPRLFGRFERLHRTKLPSVKGSGLGLYIVKQIIEAHGGTIQVDSTPGQGTTFTIEMPAQADFD